MVSGRDCLLDFGNQHDIGRFFICHFSKLNALFNYHKGIDVTALPFSDNTKTVAMFFVFTM